MTQQRWFCHTCQREWLYARNWTPEDGCPGCHGSQIELVVYGAAFPGGDIPRGPLGVELTGGATIPARDVVQPPPAALMASVERDEKNDPIW